MGKIKNLLPDLLIVSGAALIVCGAWLLHQSAGLAVAGVMIAFVGFNLDTGE